MNVLVTGATGFVGQHLVRALLKRGHRVVAVARDEAKARPFDWYSAVTFRAADIHACDVRALTREVDVIAHLAWPGLPNYSARFHFEENLLGDYAFLKAAVGSGIRRVLVTGTCLEYGAAQAGCLDEDTVPAPDLSYAIAKDTLRKFLQVLCAEQPFSLQWVRLFYMHGPGQNAKSLLSQLDAAIASGKRSFDMSAGEQLRDYLPVTRVAAMLTRLIEHPKIQGAINCCSGAPISVRRLVEDHLRSRNAELELNLGVFPYPDYEPLAFWGSSKKLMFLRHELESDLA